MSLFAELDIDFLIATARAAGDEILDVYRGDIAVQDKDDKSPLTEADLRAHRLIDARLKEHYPDIPVLSEESSDHAEYSIRKDWKRYFLVDPLDGTKEFIKRNGQFTVNIAVIENSVPAAGVVHAPHLDWTYWGAVGEGAFKTEGGGEPVRLAPQPSGGGKVVIVGSRSHPTPEMDAFVEEQKRKHAEVEFIAMGSSLKLCAVAEGKADVYPRFGPTMEWDTGAAHAVVKAAGRQVYAHETGEELPYNKENLLNGWFIVQ